MTLLVETQHGLGDFRLDAAFASDGGVTALFGRSGSGKSSMVRIIAGLTRPDRGRVEFDGQVLVDTSAGVFVPAHKRRFGCVFQDARLFPHLSVRQNLVYGRWFAPKADRTDGFERVIALLGIEPLLERAPAKLSGGEKQRVAIGRALLSSPRLLLMDEPLAALDEARKTEIIPYLERLRDEMAIPIIYVSHSVSEVARLADRVVLLRDGRVEAIGTPSEVLRGSPQSSPAERREAGSVLTGVVAGIDPAHRLATIRLSGRDIMVPNADVTAGRAVRLHIPARDVMIATHRPEGLSALNILEGRVAEISVGLDGTANIGIDCGGDLVLARITLLSVERLSLAIGKPVFAVIKTVALESR
jgi:molybdate transport system ATP-binding protein